VTLFNLEIKKENVGHAQEIQEIIFEKIRNHEINMDVLNELSVPEQAAFGLLKNNQIAFAYANNQIDLFVCEKK